MIRRAMKVCCTLVTFGVAICGQNTPKDASGDFGARYVSLKPEQKTLVDDWVRRFSATMQKQVDPEKAYDNLPLSSKTTFNAVTHALLSTQLTDHTGGALGSAFQIIDKLDTVRGEVQGTKGDLQFRIYVQLKPGAVDLLEKSREFRRMDDNTVYHKGYPICFRGTPAVPSIQVSATRDKARADVDVDYKSSGFPKGLVNGHLGASNSDVRAGRNDEIHNNRWLGLNNWWRSLLSLPSVEEKPNGRFEDTGIVPVEPASRAGMKPADAVFDMLSTWLVKRDPESVLSYFAEQAIDCVLLEDRDKADHGMARFQLLKALQRVNQQFGNVGQLGDISAAAPLKTNGSRSKAVQHPHQDQFALYDVREDAAERFKCINRLDATLIYPKAAASTAFGKYYGAVFRLGRKGDDNGTTLATLWAKEAKGWKLISYDVDPGWDDYQAPDTAAAAPDIAPAVYVAAPVEMVGAGTKFLESWLVNRNVDEALGYVSAVCDECVKLSADQPPKTADEARVQMRQAMRQILETTGRVKRLDEAIAAPEPNHADIKLVRHRNSKAFALVSIPDYMASALDCKRRVVGAPVAFQAPAGEKSWGKYYAIGLRLAKAGEDSGVLWTVWAQEAADWKMVAYTVLAP